MQKYWEKGFIEAPKEFSIVYLPYYKGKYGLSSPTSRIRMVCVDEEQNIVCDQTLTKFFKLIYDERYEIGCELTDLDNLHWNPPRLHFDFENKTIHEICGKDTILEKPINNLKSEGFFNKYHSFKDYCYSKAVDSYKLQPSSVNILADLNKRLTGGE